MQRILSTAGCPDCGCSPKHGIAIPSSPVPTLLHTHVAPSPSEAELIQSTLSHVHSSISEIDQEIDRVQAILDLLKNKRGDLQIFADRHGALLAPVRRLPPELLAEVFVHCLPSQQIVATMAGKRSILRPSHVCQHWRNVAVSTQRLWTSICVDAIHYKSQTALAKAWLSRAGSCPLSIRVEVSSWDFDASTIQLIIDTLLPYCNRWQYVEMSDMPWLVISALATARNNLPCLETLSLDTWEQLDVVNIFEFAPKLRALYLGQRIQPLDVHVPWSQLTHLRAKTSVDKWHAVLMLVPNIITLDVQLVRDDVNHSSVLYPIIQLSQLTKLELLSSSDFGPFLDYLSLPILRDFFYEDALHGWNQQQFISCLSRSSCSLRSLSIRHSDLCDELSQILEHTPELVDLRLGPYNVLTMSQLTCRKAPYLITPLPRLILGR
jgi:hypothetical protein